MSHRAIFCRANRAARFRSSRATFRRRDSSPSAKATFLSAVHRRALNRRRAEKAMLLVRAFSVRAVIVKRVCVSVIGKLFP